MRPDFDVIIVGSGPAGVSAAYPLVLSGLSVLMVDGGKAPKTDPIREDYLSERLSDMQQWKWMIGENYYALKNNNSISPKLRIPQHEYVFEEFEAVNKITSSQYSVIGSLAKGGSQMPGVVGCATFEGGSCCISFSIL